MLRIKKEFFRSRPTMYEVAQSAGIKPETLNRIVNNKQRPSFKAGHSAERIAQALGWEGDVHALFEEVGGE